MPKYYISFIPFALTCSIAQSITHLFHTSVLTCSITRSTRGLLSELVTTKKWIGTELGGWIKEIILHTSCWKSLIFCSQHLSDVFYKSYLQDQDTVFWRFLIFRPSSILDPPVDCDPFQHFHVSLGRQWLPDWKRLWHKKLILKDHLLFRWQKRQLQKNSSFLNVIARCFLSTHGIYLDKSVSTY